MSAPAYFEIQASDLDRAAKFYEAAFGWRFTEQAGLGVRYLRIDASGMQGGLLERPVPAPPARGGTNAFVCSMEVDSFDETAARILGHGGIVALEKFAVPGRCWQGYFLDLDGNTFGIFEVDPQAS